MLTADSARLPEARDDNRRAVDEAAALGASCLVLVVGGLPQYSRAGSAPYKDLPGARAQVEEGIATLLDYARGGGMPLAVEPLHPMYAADRACVNTLAQALDICDRLDPERKGGIGVAVDIYHVWWDPALWEGIARAGKDRLLAYHVCDWLVPTRDMLNDRGMMGDGVVDLKRVRGSVEAVGYAGFSEVEIFSDAWGARPLAEVLETCIARHKEVV
jgi:sugar phosphate isomerase/epimerase